MSNTTTTSDAFPVIDVTHRPHRKQADNLLKAGVLPNSEKAREAVQTPLPEPLSDSPHAMSLESAIAFYESHSLGADLYAQTALWLRELITKRQPRVAE